jgi:hypothetical protein
MIRLCIGALLIVLGFILRWWSIQLLWILIHPPPLAKLFVDSLPFVFWVIGALFIVDTMRRMMRAKKYVLD